MVSLIITLLNKLCGGNTSSTRDGGFHVTIIIFGSRIAMWTEERKQRQPASAQEKRFDNNKK